MTVIDRRKRSARGKNAMMFFVLAIVCQIAAGCGREHDRQHLPREQFVQIYGDMLFLAEFHRYDKPAYRRSLDSMCRARKIDTAQIASSMRWHTRDKEEMSRFYEEVLKHLEKKAKVTKR